jgi:transposase
MSHEEAAEVLSVSKRTVGNLLERFAGWAQEKVKARAMAEPTAEAAAGATSSTGDG